MATRLYTTMLLSSAHGSLLFKYSVYVLLSNGNWILPSERQVGWIDARWRDTSSNCVWSSFFYLEIWESVHTEFGSKGKPSRPHLHVCLKPSINYAIHRSSTSTDIVNRTSWERIHLHCIVKTEFSHTRTYQIQSKHTLSPCQTEYNVLERTYVIKHVRVNIGVLMADQDKFPFRTKERIKHSQTLPLNLHPNRTWLRISTISIKECWIEYDIYTYNKLLAFALPNLCGLSGVTRTKPMQSLQNLIHHLHSTDRDIWYNSENSDKIVFTFEFIRWVN